MEIRGRGDGGKGRGLIWFRTENKFKKRALELTERRPAGPGESAGGEQRTGAPAVDVADAPRRRLDSVKEPAQVELPGGVRETTRECPPK
jgi:hypothetical protein